MVIKFDRYEQEKFDKLNQLDRIEYLITRDHLEKHIDEPTAFDFFLKGFTFLTVILFLSTIIVLLKPNDTTLHFVQIVTRMLGIFTGLLIVSIILEHIIYTIKNKKAKEYLESKFFKGKNK